jgi:hypothetical protein
MGTGGVGNDTPEGASPDEEMPGAGSDDMEGEEEVAETARTENPEQQGLDLPDNAVNLVPYLLELAETDDKVKKFVHDELPNQVIRHFNEDWESRKGWMDNMRERVDLYLGNLKQKTEPFRNCANLHDPILLKCTLRLVARIWSEIFTDGQPLFRARAGSRLTEQDAEIITKHENWQFSKEIPDFPAQVWRALTAFIRDGEMVFDSYRDYVHGVNRHEFVGPEEFVYPYARHPVAPDMSDVPRKTKIMFPYKRDLMAMQELGFYSQVDKVTECKGSHDLVEVDQVVRDAVDKWEGTDRSQHTHDAPYYLLEQHTWVKLPYAEKDEPFRVVVDAKTRVVLGLFSRYYDDPEDRVRYEREMSEYQMYAGNLEQYAMILQEEQNTLLTLQQPNVPPDEAAAIAEHVQANRPAPPMKPKWMAEDENGQPSPPKTCKKKIIERFSRATCIDNPEGSHGIGVGTLIMPHQMAANIMLNQSVDAGTLANSSTAVVHDMVKFPPGMTSIAPNEIIKIRGVPPDQISSAFFRFDHQPANPQLMQWVQSQEAAADGVSSTPDVLSGQKEGDETFRGMATRVEQATKQTSAIAAKGMVALNQVAQNNGLLNFFFLPEVKEVDARNPATGALEPITVSRDLYRDRYDIIFSADLSFASRATKVAEADDAMALLLKGVPPQVLTLVIRPEGVGAAIRKCLQARGMFDIASYMYSDQEIGQKMMAQQQAQAMASMPPGAQGPGAPPPSIPDGQPSNPAPGPQIAHGTPAEAAPNVRQ